MASCAQAPIVSLGFEVAGVLTSLTATEGMRVSAGDVLAQLGIDRRQARLDAAIAAYDRVVAERGQAEARADRIASLIKDGSASQQDYDDARVRYPSAGSGGECCCRTTSVCAA